MKKLSLLTLALSLWLSTSAFADSFTLIDSNHEYSLKECGGTIEATVTNAGNGADQINFVLRNVENCSNIEVRELNKTYKIQGENGNRSGSFTIPASILPTGANYLTVTVRSNSSAHLDYVTFPVKVIRNESIVGQKVYVPSKGAFAKVLLKDLDGSYYLQFTTGDLNGLVGGNWSVNSMVLLSQESCSNLCVGNVVIVPSREYAFAKVAAIQKDGKYVLEFLTTKLAGKYGHNWTADLLVY